MISALLIDDEPAANQRLSRLLKTHPEVQVLGAVESVAAALDFLSENKPDVIFLDVDMPGRTGLDLLPELGAQIAVVFVTAHERYAVSAFEVGAVDYLLKPVNPQRLALMIPRLLRAVSQRNTPSVANAAKTTLQPGDTISFAISGSRELKICRLSEIVWIEAMQNYSLIQLRNLPTALPTRRSLSEWEALLSEPFFYRLNRSLIIQPELLRSTEWNPRSQSRLTFEGAAEALTIGRHAAARLKEILEKPLNC
ncbi:MAG: LytTR family DNA-binding domain-containing protein [Verrucomicrobiales bacterium]